MAASRRRGHDAHRLGHRQGRAAHVDRVAAGAQALAPLHDRGPESVAGQPVGEGGAGDAGTGDQYCPESCLDDNLHSSADLQRVQICVDAVCCARDVLRDRKRARTRQALVDAATELFERNGYDETTVADIAAAAEIGTRTFFSYFASKEELLFPESDARVRAAVEAIASRGPATTDRPRCCCGPCAGRRRQRRHGGPAGRAAAAAHPDGAGGTRAGRCRSSSTRSARSPGTWPRRSPTSSTRWARPR